MLQTPSLRFTRETYEEIATSSTSYVRLKDLQQSDAAVASGRHRLYLLPRDHEEEEEEDSDAIIPCFCFTAKSTLALTATFVVAALVIACTQLYQGSVCVIASLEQKGKFPHCEAYATRSVYLDTGAPDVQLLSPFSSSISADEEVVRFQGGWPMANSLFHAFGCFLLLIAISLVRILRPHPGHGVDAMERKYAFNFWVSFIWIGFVLLFLFMIFYDFITMEQWKITSCPAIRRDLLLHHQENARDDRSSCLYWRFALYIFLLVCILCTLMMYLALEPLQQVFQQLPEHDRRQDHSNLIVEDQVTCTAYRRL